MNFKEELIKEGILIDEKMKKDFESFYTFLVEQNKITNLTRIVEKDDVYFYHFYDSLMCLKAIKKKDNIKLLDIGSGPGFPGVPLNIANPNIDLTIVEATNKKVEFIKKNVANLGLDNVRIFHSRAEDFKELDSFDYVTTRAVSTIKEQLPYTIPFLKIGGRLISMKGDLKAQDEINESIDLLKKIGAKVIETIKYKVKERDYVLVVIEKVSKTPKGYPIVLHKEKK